MCSCYRTLTVTRCPLYCECEYFDSFVLSRMLFQIEHKCVLRTNRSSVEVKRYAAVGIDSCAVVIVRLVCFHVVSVRATQEEHRSRRKKHENTRLVLVQCRSNRRTTLDVYSLSPATSTSMRRQRNTVGSMSTGDRHLEHRIVSTCSAIDEQRNETFARYAMYFSFYC
jgi:hypothetical protein